VATTNGKPTEYRSKKQIAGDTKLCCKPPASPQRHSPPPSHCRDENVVYSYPSSGLSGLQLNTSNAYLVSDKYRM